MDNEQLIEMVKEYRFLYDLDDKKYCDGQKKDKAWKEIGKRLNSSGKECKKTWSQLRDSFRRCVKKRKNNIRHKRWKYEDEMAFLLPYLKERPTVCRSPSALEYEGNTDEEDNIAQAPELRQQTDYPLASTFSVSQHTASKLLTRPSPATAEEYPQPKRTKRGPNRTDKTPNADLMKLIMDSKKHTPPSDDIGLFMAGITTTLRSFPPRDRAIAKAEIFEIVSRMEINILSRPSNSMVSTSSSYNTNSDENSQRETQCGIIAKVETTGELIFEDQE